MSTVTTTTTRTNNMNKTEPEYDSASDSESDFSKNGNSGSEWHESSSEDEESDDGSDSEYDYATDEEVVISPKAGSSRTRTCNKRKRGGIRYVDNDEDSSDSELEDGEVEFYNSEEEDQGALNVNNVYNETRTRKKPRRLEPEMETPERSVKWLQIEELAERIKELNKKYENLIEGKQNAKRLVLNGFKKVLKDSHVHNMGMRVAKQTGWVTKFNSIPTDNSDLERWKNRLQRHLETEWKAEADRLCAATKNQIYLLFGH